MRCLLPVFVALILAGNFSARAASAYNYTVSRDTMSDTTDTNTIRYGNAFELSKYEDIRWIVKVRDTSSAGFASDSIKYLVGYQTGTPTFNTSNARDTVWSERLVVLDTLDSDSLGAFGTEYGTVAEDGTLSGHKSAFDTSSVTGWAVRSIWFKPEWDVLIRPWIKTRTGCNGQKNPFIIESVRRLGVKVDN